MQRIKQYSNVSTSLACLSNEKLKQILADIPIAIEDAKLLKKMVK